MVNFAAIDSLVNGMPREIMSSWKRVTPTHALPSKVSIARAEGIRGWSAAAGTGPMDEQKIVPYLPHDPRPLRQWPWSMSGICSNCRGDLKEDVILAMCAVESVVCRRNR
jgi:hypothetical protein